MPQVTPYTQLLLSLSNNNRNFKSVVAQDQCWYLETPLKGVKVVKQKPAWESQLSLFSTQAVWDRGTDYVKASNQRDMVSNKADKSVFCTSSLS